MNFCGMGSVIGLVAQSSHPPFRRRPVPQPDGDEQSALLDPSAVDNEQAGDWIPPAPTSFALEALTACARRFDRCIKTRHVILS